MLTLNCAPKSDRTSDFVKHQSEKISDGSARRTAPVRVDRLRERLDSLGMTARDAALRSGLERTYVTDVMEGRKQNIRVSAIIKLAETLECSTDYLRGNRSDVGGGAKLSRASDFEGAPVTKMSETLVLAGGIEPGKFDFPNPIRDKVNINPDKRYLDARQCAFKVIGGDLVSAGMPDGTLLVCVNAQDYVERYGPLKNGSTAIVKTSSSKMSGRELAVRRLEISDGQVQACSITDPAGGMRVALGSDLRSEADGWTREILFVVTRLQLLLD